MKLDLSDSLSNNSDFSSDSQHSHLSTTDFITTGNGLLLTPTTFITLEGLNSGVPTRTTPTLTPTTLRNIEQTFIELQSKPESHENEAGFVPPLVHAIGNNQYIPASEVDIYSKSSSSPWQSSISPHSQDSNSRPTPPVTPKSNNMNTTTETTGRRNMGGRKPVKDLNLTPEEEERRRIRRERNKMAAARCRKRRVDHTNALIAETELLEQKKQSLQNEIQELQAERDGLKFYLESHCASQYCKRNRPVSPPDVKPYDLPAYNDKNGEERVKTELIEPMTDIMFNNDYFTAPNPAKKIMLSSTVPISKPNRPSFLNVTTTPSLSTKNNVSELAGITISTPTTGIQLNFDSLMVGGTGLTPVSAPLVQCSTQQRNNPISSGDISSPDSCGPPKLE